MIAAEHGCTESCRALIEKRADLELRSQAVSYDIVHNYDHSASLTIYV